MTSTAPSLAPPRSWRWHFPYRLRGSKNIREHPKQRAKRVQKERDATTFMAWKTLGRNWTRDIVFPVEVQITRYGPRLLDSDNADTACSGVRDAVAALLGIDDGPHDTRGVWPRAKQRKGDFHVEIEIRCIGEGS